jgi:hypothetical protein
MKKKTSHQLRIVLLATILLLILSGCTVLRASPAPEATTPPPPSPTLVPPSPTPVPLSPTPVPPDPTAAPTLQPTVDPALQRPARLLINALEFDYETIAVGLDAQAIPIVPDHDVGWYQYSARPGEGENIVFWAHVLRFQHAPDVSAPFARIHELALGSPITLVTADGASHTYAVTRQVWVLPHEVEYILPQGREQLTLVSCIGDKVIVDGGVSDMSHRLITIAEPVE